MDDNRESCDPPTHSSTNNSEKDTKATTEDAELDSLLDSALEDFEAPLKGCQAGQTSSTENQTKDVPSASSASTTSSSTSGTTSAEVKPPPGVVPPGQEAMFEELFSSEFAGNAQKDFQEAMQSFMADPEMAQNFEKLAKAAGAADSGEGQKVFADTLHETLGSLSNNAQELQNEFSEEDLIRMMSMGLEDTDINDSEGNMYPMMQGMMKSLLSKDVLYPSLRDIVAKYPQWLEENKDKISATDFSKYQKQLDHMQRICGEFEGERETDSDSSKQERFDRVLNLMQEMQEFGQPPKEIVGDMAPSVDLDENGLPKMPGAEQCVVM